MAPNAAGLDLFPSWLAVLTWIEAGREIFYHAPLDRQPIRVTAVRGRGSYRHRVKVYPPTNDADPFWADLGHLGRFWRIPDERQPETPEQPREKAYETAEYRAERREKYHTDDPRRVFEEAIGRSVHDRSYDRFLTETIAELRKEGENHGKQYRSLMPIAAELIEYWYNNAPETLMYRDQSPAELRKCFESHRPAAFWVRLLRMEHERERETAEEDPQS